jgi:hypothetical protein
MKSAIEYHISVDHQESGHPIQRIEYTFDGAAKSFDDMCAHYPKRTVRLFSVIKEELRKRGPILGHTERRKSDV